MTVARNDTCKPFEMTSGQRVKVQDRVRSGMIAEQFAIETLRLMFVVS
jgi:hypothetical protein